MRFTALLTYLFLSMISLAQTSPHHSQDSLLTDTLQLSAAGDNCVYDLQGRCVVSGKTVTNGTWRQGLSRGIYLLNGKKYVVR